MIKRFLSFFLAFLMTVFLLYPGKTAFAETGSQVDAKLTNVSIQDSDGNPVTEVPVDQILKLVMDWHVDQIVHDGDYFDIDIPKELDMTTSATNPLTFDLTDQNGTKVATAEIISRPTATATTGGGKIRVKFNHNAEGLHNITGQMHVYMILNKKGVTINKVNPIEMKVNGRTDLTPPPTKIGVKPGANTSDQVLGKFAKSSDASHPGVAGWALRINQAKKDLKHVVIRDSITSGNGHYLDPLPNGANEQFKLMKCEYDASGNPTSWDGEIVDLTGKVKFNTDKTSFEIDLGDIGTQSYFLSYKTTVDYGDPVQTNQANMTADTITPVDQKSTWKKRSGGGSMAGDLAKKLKLRKVDAEDNTKALANAEFEVTKPDGSKFTLTTGADGTVTSGLLIPGKYKVRETKAPQGYLLDSTEYTVDIASDVGTILTVKDKLNATSVKVTKQWVGTPAASVEIKLFADGQDANKSLTLNAAGNWEGKFENLPKYKADGSEIVYTVRETPVAGYTTAMTGDAANGFIITNTIAGKVSVPVEKKWVGPKGASATMHLYANGADTGKSITLDETNHWQYTFADLEKYDHGNEIQYTIVEDPIANYDSQTTGDASQGFVVTNSNTEKIDVPVKKQWVGTPAVSVEIKLFADGQDANKSLTLNAAGNWEGKFENLPKYKADGSEIVYTVQETPVAGYTTTIEGDTEHGYVVTNKANVTKKDKPKKPGSTPKAPKTGDLGNVDWYMFTAFASLQALIVFALLKRRKANEK